MKKIAIAALALSSFAGSAFAADIAAKPVYKAPPPAPVYSWTGCYIGAGGGTGMWNSDDQTFFLGGGAASNSYDNGGRGWFGTVQGGCDYQFAQNWVFGAFADYDFGSIKGDSNLNANGVNYLGEEKQNWSWAVGARLGWLPFDNLLAYVSGGYTQAHYRSSDYAINFPGQLPLFTIDAHTYDGWFLGTGYEYRIGWLPGLTWKTEYRFADYGTDNLTVFNFGTTVPAFNVDREKFVHTIRSELVWRFSPWR